MYLSKYLDHYNKSVHASNSYDPWMANVKDSGLDDDHQVKSIQR